MKASHFLAVFLFSQFLVAQTPYPDSVISVNYGFGAGFGQSCFPDNILGFPASDATASAPAFREEDVLTLGSGGSITLMFTDNEVVNGPGADFTVFENVFYIGGDSTRPFRETALVEVSYDGIYWQTFPFDSADGAGLAGISPTNGYANPQDPDSSGGDSFDLNDLEEAMDIIRYIRLTDADTFFTDEGSGFDLDAVVGIHSRSVSHIEMSYVPEQAFIVNNYPNPFNAATMIHIHSRSDIRADITLYDNLGRRIKTLYENHLFRGGTSRLPVRLDSDLAGGIYFLQISGDRLTAVKKIIFLP